MLDGRGRVRLTDFGLASEAAGGIGAGETAGTPAYMAPELLSGKPATVQSDVYALGLVLYEVFSGKRAFAAATIAGLRQQQESGEVAALSSATGTIDPAIEEVVSRCLDRNPAARPASAISVAARLPGGDPLAAALAAGETPSPAMVAAAGESSGLRPRVATACLVGFFVLLAAVVALVGDTGSRGWCRWSIRSTCSPTRRRKCSGGLATVRSRSTWLTACIGTRSTSTTSSGTTRGRTDGRPFETDERPRLCSGTARARAS